MHTRECRYDTLVCSFDTPVSRYSGLFGRLSITTYVLR
jgi:hypothetical protein